MTTEEFSNEFDTLIQSYMTSPGYGEVDTMAFTEYEKSVFLTKALEDIVVEFYSGKNYNSDSFEKTEEIRRYLDNLVLTYETGTPEEGIKGINNSSVLFKIPLDLWFTVYESATLNEESTCIKGTIVPVIPIRHNEFHRLRKNPFRGASRNRVLRLSIKDNIVELISNYPINSYLVRYLTKPNPIIIENLSEDLLIDNQTKKSECQLHSALHRLILDRAVKYALSSKAMNVNNVNNVNK